MIDKAINTYNTFCDYLRSHNHEDDALDIIYELHDFFKSKKKHSKVDDEYYEAFILLFEFLNDIEDDTHYAFTREDQIEFVYDEYELLLNNRDIETIEDKEKWLYDVTVAAPKYIVDEDGEGYLYYDSDEGKIAFGFLDTLVSELFDGKLETAYPEIQLYIIGKS